MGLYRTTEEVSTPATPAAGSSILYPKSDGLWYWKDDAGVEHAVVGADSTQTLSNKTLAGFVLSGNVTQTGNPSINIGTGAFTAGATSLGGAVTFTGTAIGAAADRWIGTDGGTGMFINAPTSTSVTIGVNNAAIGAFSGTGAAFTTFRTNGYTVGTLPAGVTGMRVYVTDATAPTYNGALTGGGAVTVPAFYNGAAWVSA